MARMVDVEDLGGALEIARLTGVTRAAVYDWSTRPGFPAPVVQIGGKTRLWLLSQVSEWVAVHYRVVDPGRDSATGRFKREGSDG